MGRRAVTALRDFAGMILHAARNLLPIILVVGFFQLVVMREVPEGWLSMSAGLGVVVLGVALFLQGLELGIFPVGKNLSNEFARRGSLILLMGFGFCLGFAAVIAEPALIAVAGQAETISEGRIDAFVLRLLVATSVGAVTALGILRTVLGHSLHWYMIVGYVLVVLVTFFAPEEIVGLAYDSGGVTTNIVTVPLIAALGIGLATSIRGRNALTHGFGLVALAVMVPMISVQLYGVVVYTLADPGGVPATAGPALQPDSGPAAEPVGGSLLLGMGAELAGMVRDVLPIILVVLVFQYAVIRKRLPHLQRALVGFVLVSSGCMPSWWGSSSGSSPSARAWPRSSSSATG